MESGLPGRTALITGGSRGIGFAIAEALSAEGVAVAIAARHRDQLDTAVERLGPDAVALPLVADLTERDSVDRMVAAAAEWRGGLNILVNNAGPIMQSGKISETADGPWADTFGTKAMGTIRASRAALNVLADDGSGRIINITGVTTKTLIPNAGISGITNAALTAFTRYLAAEAAGRRILVNAVCPGMTLTQGWYDRAQLLADQQKITRDAFFAGIVDQLGILAGRWAEPREIANTVVFLASDLASYITAQTITVDGGISAHTPLA